MGTPASPSSLYTTPKRKRDDQDSVLPDAPSPSRLRTTNLPCRSIEEELTNSPRTVAAGRFQNLDLEEHPHIPQLDFGRRPEAQMGISKEILESGGFHPQISLPTQSFNGPMTPPLSSSGPPVSIIQTHLPQKPATLPLEIPETPRLRPVSSPTPPPSATKSKSPPPNTSISPTLWWNDTEITGHNPSDPTDDGYGINGVGFLPTPAIANARAERRKKQVAEWKNREARDARQKRSDRRRRRDAEAGPMSSGIESGDSGTRADEGRKVRFLDL